MVRILFVLAAISSSMLFASAKDDLVKAIMNQCGKSEADAKALATPGRTGTVVRFRFCHSPEVKTKDESCTVTCTKGSSTIGG